MTEGNDIADCEVCHSHHDHHHKRHQCDSECGYGFACHHPRYFLARWIVGLIILIAIFCVGVTVGKFSAWADGDYYGYGYRTGPGAMMVWGASGNASYGPAMMYGWNPEGNYSTSQTVPAGTKQR